ncbi:MAG: adhesin [Chloroflexi bacterium]|nr:adhesin [Chloroflexota bacterium]
MKLPRGDRAVIDPRKFRDYLLSTSHPIGRFNARFFGKLGYTNEDWQRLESDLRNFVASEDAVLGQESSYGQKYEVRGTLTGPSGTMTEIITVWIVLADEDAPRFVTAFPGAKT